MSEIIEQVAQAICGDNNPENILEIHRIRARAAIEAYQSALWPPMSFETTRALTIDRRRMRANQLTAHIMHTIGKYLCRHGEVDGAREASAALFEMLYEAGADIITDLDRANAGLAPRDHSGMTREELHILEMKRIEAMLAPRPPFVMPGV